MHGMWYKIIKICKLCKLYSKRKFCKLSIIKDQNKLKINTLALKKMSKKSNADKCFIEKMFTKLEFTTSVVSVELRGHSQLIILYFH